MPTDRPPGSAARAPCGCAAAKNDVPAARYGCTQCFAQGPHCMCARASSDPFPVFEHYDRSSDSRIATDASSVESHDAFAADGEQCGIIALPTLHTQQTLLVATHSSQDEPVTTIYMAGFPEDFREREFHNLFAFAQGYEGCSLKYPASGHESAGDATKTPGSGQILGFARFRTIADALEACRVLNGRVLDAERGSMLRVEMAKKNLILGPARSRSTFLSFAPAPATHVPTLPPAMLPSFNVSVASAPATCSPKRALSRATPMAGAEAIQGATRRSSLSSLPPWPESADDGAGNRELASGGSTPPARETRSLSLCVPGSAQPVPVVAPVGQTRRTDGLNAIQTNTATVHGEHPPCNTLYVGNLPAGVCELELRALFCAAPGYRRLSLKAKPGGSPMCFVEFEDVASATAAMEALYGTALSNSAKGGIRLSYSKNPLGVRPAPYVPLFPSAYSSVRTARASGSGDFYLDTAPWGGLVAAAPESSMSSAGGSSSAANDAFFADLFTPLRISPGCERRASASAPIDASPAPALAKPSSAPNSPRATTKAPKAESHVARHALPRRDSDVDAHAFEPDDIGATAAGVAAARVLFASA